MSEIEKNARNYLSSHSVNWQLGLDILEALVMAQGDRALATQVLHRVVELKPLTGFWFRVMFRGQFHQPSGPDGDRCFFLCAF